MRAVGSRLTTPLHPDDYLGLVNPLGSPRELRGRIEKVIQGAKTESVPLGELKKLSEERKGESSLEIRNRVTAAREIQTKRFKDKENVHYNAQMNTKHIQSYCKLEDTSKGLLRTAMERLNLSARAYDRILKVSRTIADLEGNEVIKPAHISEAIQYRSLDREGWAG